MMELNESAEIFKKALTEERPVHALLDLINSFSEHDLKTIWNVDVMLSGRFIDFVRNGTKDDFDLFIHALLSFLHGDKGDLLRKMHDGERYYYRWEHFQDLCDAALEDYDSSFTERFVASRKQGNRLMEILFSAKEGLRHKELAAVANISPQYLSKLLRDFKEQRLITVKRDGKASLVRLSFLGEAFMHEKLGTFDDIAELDDDALKETFDFFFGKTTKELPILEDGPLTQLVFKPAA
jgi:hypothetical protein